MKNLAAVVHAKLDPILGPQLSSEDSTVITDVILRFVEERVLLFETLREAVIEGKTSMEAHVVFGISEYSET